ncbi:MAG: transketolase family protein [Bacteroidales bacterium]|jgi:transketolase|nr:transketolase family protein [Bacteroidales bacterium]MDI9576465.1 transketolase family protein [Bacteroidota bacterium]MDD2592928.1 transketolase family protein [Bacteroidales bacterium]MDD3755823.1 transketolase family protein [Bacteroidales bacterium]MDY0401118.1 transketolase family protein [Bacteroidales bacterium]
MLKEKFHIKQKKDTRSGFGDELYELGTNNPKVVALTADLTGSLKMDKFAKSFPDRFIQVGIAEANMMGIAAGLANAGFIPFTGTFAVFSTGRVYDQVRQSIAYSYKNVKICASHAGISLGEDGASHQMMEDIALMRALPNIIVINPADYTQTRQAVRAIAKYLGPVYLRFGRPAVPDFIPDDMPFEIGKAITLKTGKDVTIFATGHLVWEAVEACDELEKMGIDAELVEIHTIKPIDENAIINSIKKTKCAVTAEEHVLHGGLGDAVAQVSVKNYSVPIEYVAMDCVFGESGTPNELMVKYGLKSTNIVNAAINSIKRKNY